MVDQSTAVAKERLGVHLGGALKRPDLKVAEYVLTIQLEFAAVKSTHLLQLKFLCADLPDF